MEAIWWVIVEIMIVNLLINQRLAFGWKKLECNRMQIRSDWDHLVLDQFKVSSEAVIWLKIASVWQWVNQDWGSLRWVLSSRMEEIQWVVVEIMVKRTHCWLDRVYHILSAWYRLYVRQSRNGHGIGCYSWSARQEEVAYDMKFADTKRHIS